MLKPVVLLALVFTLAPSFAEAAKCPVINGRFGRIVEKDGKQIRQNRFQYTRVERGVYSYSLGKESQFQVADGIPRPIKRGDSEGTITFSCGNNSLIVVSMANDATEPYRVEMRPISENELSVDETNAARSGIYTLVL